LGKNENMNCARSLDKKNLYTYIVSTGVIGIVDNVKTAVRVMLRRQ